MAADKPDQEKDLPDQDKDLALRARLDSLGAALGKTQAAKARQAAEQSGGSAARTGSAMAIGFRAATELGAGVIVGGLIGWQLDKWLGTSPWALLVFFFLGTGAGFWNLYRIAMRPTPAALETEGKGPVKGRD